MKAHPIRLEGESMARKDFINSIDALLELANLRQLQLIQRIIKAILK